MNSYRIIDVEKFPQLTLGQEISTGYGQALAGFTKRPDTSIKFENLERYGYAYYEIQHEMIIKDNGKAYGFYEGEPVNLEFYDYLKKFTIPCYYNVGKKYMILATPSIVFKDLFGVIEDNKALQCKINKYDLNLLELKNRVGDFLGVWFKKVSTRVNASALFGSDLLNEPLFGKILDDGAELSSITIPFKNLTIQLNQNAGISSHQKIDSILNELVIVEAIKEALIDPIRIKIELNTDKT